MYTFFANRKKYSVEYSGIQYLESQGRRIILVIDKERFIFYGTLRDEYLKLRNADEKIFVQISRSVVVNIRHIKYTDYYNVRMNNGELLPVSRNYRKQVAGAISVLGF